MADLGEGSSKRQRKKIGAKALVTKRGAEFSSFSSPTLPAVKFLTFINYPWVTWVSEDGFVFTLLALNVRMPQQVCNLPELKRDGLVIYP